MDSEKAHPTVIYPLSSYEKLLQIQILAFLPTIKNYYFLGFYKPTPAWTYMCTKLVYPLLIIFNDRSV